MQLTPHETSARGLLIDTHAHLADAKFDGAHDEIIGRARACGVGGIISVGDSVEASAACRDLAARWPDVVRFSAGVHPHNARDWVDDKAGQSSQNPARPTDPADATDHGGDAPPRLARRGTLEAIRTLAADRRCVAIGEIGLDYHYNFSPRERQREVFAAQLSLANDLRLPVILHCREAYDDFLAILRECPIGAAGGVVHCFAAGPREARQILDLGLRLGVGGVVTFKSAGEVRAGIALAPLESLVVETDAPYMAPVPHRGRRNEPAFVRDVAEFLGRERGLAFEAIAHATTANARRLFALRDSGGWPG